MCEVLLTTEAELAKLAEKIPAAADGYTSAALYGLPSRPTRVELFHPHDDAPTVYVMTRGRKYERRCVDYGF